MSYSTTYTDENGISKEFSITEEDAREALKNDFIELQKKYNSRYVIITREKTAPGEELHLKITVKAPSHYVTGLDDYDPKPCDSMSVDVICYRGYPISQVTAAYAPNRRLASPNVFKNGGACIDTWIPFTSSLLTVADKLVHDMIHDPIVTRYESPACSELIQWHKRGVASGKFPTISPRVLQATDLVPLPPRRTKLSITRPLPPRRH